MSTLPRLLHRLGTASACAAVFCGMFGAIVTCRSSALTSDSVRPVTAETQPGGCPVGDEVSAIGTDVRLTDRGLVRGATAGDTYAFKGIPYAAPPVGNLRWRAPTPAPCWQGVREAQAYGEVCAQSGARPGTTTTWFGSEDCLYLNVWVPNDLGPGEQLPVMVFVHGGGNTRGAGSESVSTSIATLGPNIQDGQRLAEDGHAVVVTINYRLGFLGWLAHAALRSESGASSSGNYGEMDIIAALRWVRRNIASFGGDPDRVLLSGQSAGARDVCTLAASSHAASGLFSTAAVLSGQCENLPSRAEAEAVGEIVAGLVGCGSAPDVTTCLRSRPASQLATTTVDQTKRLFGNHYFQLGPIVDGQIVSEQPLASFQSPHHRHVPVLIGSTDSETAFSLLPLMYTGPISTPADYVTAISQLAAGTTIVPDVLSEYPLSSFASPRAALIAVLTDANLICPARRLAGALAGWDEPIWRAAYVHTNSNGPSRTYGPAHVMDLGYWFDTLWQMPGFTPSANEIALAQTLPRYLTSFAKTDDPNYTGAPAVWPRYFGDTDQDLRIDAPLSGSSRFHADKCDFWDWRLPPAGWTH